MSLPRASQTAQSTHSTTRSRSGDCRLISSIEESREQDRGIFRGLYTNGLWLKGELPQNLKYIAMFATNLSILGVSASQLDNNFQPRSYMLQWLPTTGDFGLYGTFGDYDYHQKAATRLAVHYSHSLEDKQSRPGTEGIENSQIRLSDGSVIFTPNLFWPWYQRDQRGLSDDEP